MNEPQLYTFTLDYPPSLWALYTIARGRLVLTKRGREYKERAAWQAIAQGVKVPIAGAVAVEITVHPPTQIQDVDNSIKGPLDALRGRAFTDDAVIEEIHIYRRAPTVEPRLELVVASTSVAGLVLCRTRNIGAVDAGAIVDVMDAIKGE